MLKCDFNSHDIAIIYHTWRQVHGTVLSIASLRGAGCTSKIYVLERETIQCDWEQYPTLLNFEVVSWPFFFEGKTPDEHSMITSRQIDIWDFIQTIPENVILYSDTDVFWARSPLPFSQTPRKVVKNLNDGLIYFNKRTESARNYFETYKLYATKGMADKNFRDHLWSFCHWQSNKFWLGNESTSGAIRFQYPEWFLWMPDQEHAISRTEPTKRRNNFHSMGYYKWKRGAFSKWAFAFLIKEVHENVAKFDLPLAKTYEWLIPHAVPLKDESLTKLIDQLF